jgi:UMF1 family MFS transporter
MKWNKFERGLIPYSFFDFGNSSISLIIHAYLFPLFFKNVLFAGNQKADALWGSLFAISAILAAIGAPFIGRLADGKGRYGLFATLSVLSFSTMLLLALSVRSMPIVVCSAFVLMNICFYLASNIYDSLLTLVAPENRRARFSSFAWGFGYIGGIACFVGVYLLQGKTGVGSPVPYVFTALFYSVFGALSVVTLRKYISGQIRYKKVSTPEMLKALDKPRLHLLLGYWLIGDCVSAIIFFTAIYGSSELKLSDQTIGGVLLLVQFLAFPNTYLMARLADRIGLTRTLGVCVSIWCVIIVMLVVHVNFAGLIVLSVLTSFVIGSTQALMRAQYSLHLETIRTSELFGWYAIATESSSVVSPLLFGLISIVFGSQRLAMGTLSLPLLLGIWCVFRGSALLLGSAKK